MGSTFTFSSGAMAISVSGTQIAAGAAIGALGLYSFSRNKNNKIPMHGLPNSFIGKGNYEGQYDNNGNLIYRKDYGLHNGANPHTHVFNWEKIDGIWRIIKRYVLPF